MGFRIRELREESGLKQDDLADKAGLSRTQISKAETGYGGLSDPAVERIADVLGVTPAFLRYGDRQRMIQVTGLVGAYARVEAMPHDRPRWVQVPADWTDAFALEVVGDSCWPTYSPGDILVARGERRLNSGEIVGRMCVVETADGLSLVKRVRKGSRSGHYHLESPNAPTMEDVPLSSARPVKWVFHP